MFPLVNSIRIHRSFSSPLSKKAKYPLPSTQNQVSSSVWQYGYVHRKNTLICKGKKEYDFVLFCLFLFCLFVFVFLCFVFCLFFFLFFGFVLFRFVLFCFVFCLLFFFFFFFFLQCANATPNTWSKPNGKIAEEPKNQCCLMCWCNSLRLT